MRAAAAGVYRPWGRAHSSMDDPRSAHCQTKRPTSGPPPKSGLRGWSNKSPAVTLPVPSFPRVPCIKAGFRRQTHQVRPVLSYTHKNIPLNLGRAHHAPLPRPLPYPQVTRPFRLGPSRSTSFWSASVFSANLSATENHKKPPIPPPAFPSIRQDGQPNLVRSLHHCSLIRSPGPYWDNTVSKDPSAITTHPSPTDSIPRLALPSLTSLHPLTGALSCRASGHWIAPHAPAILITQNTTTLLPARWPPSPSRSRLLNPNNHPACGA